MDLTEQLTQGITAIQAGNKKDGQALLRAVVKADENQLEAWLWLSRVVDSLEEKQICLENILTLDPDNAEAQLALDQVTEQHEKLYITTYKAGEEQPPPAVVTYRDSATSPITRDYPHKDPFDNELLCPYCAKQTRAEERTCPHCHKNLIISLRIKEEPSAWLWRGIFLQVGIILFLVSVGSVGYLLGLRYIGITRPAAFLPLYFGQSVNQPQEQIELVLATFPRWLFWGWIGLLLYSTALIVVLYARQKHGNTIYMIGACFTLTFGLAGIIVFYQNLIIFWAAILCFIFGLAQMFVSFNLWSDFNFQEGRIRLKVDRGVKTHASFYLSGRKYADLGMWGMAVIHLRRAVGRDPHRAIYHMLLTLAYLNIERPDLAEKSLAEAKKLDPTAAEIQQLRRRLEKLQAKVAELPAETSG